MLTKNDLQQIRGIVRETIQEETPKIVRSIIQEETPRIVGSIIQEETPRIVGPIIQEALKPIKKQINKLQKTVDVVIDHFDKRLTKVEVEVKELQHN